MADFEQAVAIEGLRRIAVRLSRGDISLRWVEGDVVLVQSDGELRCEREEDTLHIGLSPAHSIPRPPRAPRPPAGGVAGLSGLGELIDDVLTRSLDSVFSGAFSFGGMNADLIIGIPAVLEQPVLEVHTAHGNIHLDGVHATCSIRTEAGDIVVHHAGGAVDATTGAGDVQVDGFDGPVRTSTGSGDIDLRACLAGGAVQTGSGDVASRDLGGVWRFNSGSGDIDLRVAGDASLEITTGAGDVTVAGGVLRLLQLQTGSGDIEVRSILIGDRHRLTTGQGDVKVGIADPPGARLHILTRSGSVRSEYPLVMVGKQGPQSRDGGRYVGNIGDSSVDVEVRSGSGDIQVFRLESTVPAPGRTPTTSNPSDNTPTYVDTEPNPLAEAPATPAAEPDFASDLAPERHYVPELTGISNDPRLAILESLKRGEISVDEASALLGSLEASKP